MGALADQVLALGGEVTGVIPEGLARKEVCHQGLSTTHVVRSMHERKARIGTILQRVCAQYERLGNTGLFPSVL